MKAAFYNASSGDYWQYATQSNAEPGNQIGTPPRQANYRAAGVFSVTQSAEFKANAGYLTEVGAFPGSSSGYGTFDQQGNVQEWNDLTGIAHPARGLRGGSWYQSLFFLTYRNVSSSPTYENSSTGFRVASPAARK